MTIQEAIKSGKRFRRPGWIFHWCPAFKGPLTDEVFDNLLYSDIIATDWEVEDRTVGITSTDLATAWQRATYLCDGTPTHSVLAKELGL